MGSGGKRSWFAVDLREESSSGKAWARFFPGLLEVLTSTYLLVGLAVVVFSAGGYLMLVAPLLGGGAAQKEHLKSLRLKQAALAQEKEILVQEAMALAGLEAESPGWARVLEVLAGKVPEGVWLSKVSLEEEKSSKARRSQGSTQAEAKELRYFLVVEGRVEARRFPSALEPVSRMMEELKADPGFGSVVSNLELASTQLSKDDPFLLGFQLKGTWSPESWKTKPEEKIRELLSKGASPRKEDTGGKSP